MKMRFGYLAIGLLWAGSLHAQTGPDARWAALNTLKGGKHGDLILIQPVNTAESYSGSERCRLASVGPDSLTCALEDHPTHRLVLHQRDIESIYLITGQGNHRIVKIIVGSAVGFLLGAAATDGGPNWAGAVTGGLAGAGIGATIPGLHPRGEFLSLVYFHPPPYSSVAASTIP
jgi:hypothetical protein